jgi:hypothetical protein
MLDTYRSTVRAATSVVGRVSLILGSALVFVAGVRVTSSPCSDFFSHTSVYPLSHSPAAGGTVPAACAKIGFAAASIGPWAGVVVVTVGIGLGVGGGLLLTVDERLAPALGGE